MFQLGFLYRVRWRSIVGSLATLYDGSVMLICTYIALFLIIVVRYVCTGTKLLKLLRFYVYLQSVCL